MTPTVTEISGGPDLGRCGQIVEWTDRMGLCDEFRNAAARAAEMAEFDIELARWSVDDPLAGHYVAWWENQRAILRRYLKTQHKDGTGFIVTRRTDTGDGMVKCYMRIEAGEQS